MKITMDFFIKPTKIKIIVTAIIWFTGVLHSWISAGLVWLFFPSLIATLEKNTISLRERLFADIGLIPAFFLSTSSLILEVILLYLTACIIIYLLGKRAKAQ